MKQNTPKENYEGNVKQTIEALGRLCFVRVKLYMLWIVFETGPEPNTICRKYNSLKRATGERTTTTVIRHLFDNFSLQ